MRRDRVWTWIAAFVFSATGSLAFAQSTVAAPPLDVVSVKPDNSGNKGGSISLRADGLYVQHAPFRFLLIAAYGHDFAEDHIANVPAWAGDQFDVIAKVADADLPKLKDLPREPYIEMRSLLLRAVLAQRFQMKTHTDVRQGPVYALVVDKGGAKIKLSGANPSAEWVSPSGQHVQSGTTATTGLISGHVVPLAMLVRALMSAGQLDRVVVDRTGLTGNYDYALNWTPDATSASGEDPSDTNLPSLLTAIREQLGLRLEPSMGPVNTLVIDHVEKPSEN
jgi:uncharacterized protein (TIGR03435 family)